MHPNGQYHLVTVGGHEYWSHRYEGALNGIGKAVVLLPLLDNKKESYLRPIAFEQLSFLTSEPHHHGKAAFEIIGVRPMSIWWT